MRVRILKLLEGRELCVCQLMEILGLSQSNVSGHLSILKNTGLAVCRRDGRWAYYSLPDAMKNRYAPPMLALLLGWLEEDPQVRADRRRLAALVAGKSKKCD